MVGALGVPGNAWERLGGPGTAESAEEGVGGLGRPGRAWEALGRLGRAWERLGALGVYGSAPALAHLGMPGTLESAWECLEAL